MPIPKPFAYHIPSEAGKHRIQRIREAFGVLLAELEKELPLPSREKACAITNLETSAMWATKAVTHNDPLSKVSE